LSHINSKDKLVIWDEVTGPDTSAFETHHLFLGRVSVRKMEILDVVNRYKASFVEGQRVVYWISKIHPTIHITLNSVTQ
jgi:hypothetical protein